MKKFYFFTLVAAMFAACSTDVTEDVAIEAPETLKVSFEESSRIQLDNNKTVWTKGDLVSVFYRSNAHDKYEFQGETGDADGSLKCISRGNPSVGLDKIVAVYPYSDKNLIELLTGNIQAFMPATQNYAKDSYGIGSSIMVSSSRTNTLYMKNVCGWLKVQITGEGQAVKNITIKGNNGEQVAGNVFITVDTAECTLATALNGADGNNSGDLVGTLVDPTTILTKVTLDCGEGVTLGAEPTAFYIALPPQTFAQGLTIEIEDTNAFKMTKSTEKEVVISRNAIQPMAAVEVAPADPANNEIWYAATEKVEPYFDDEFGATIISNVWDSETGKGIITFNANVTKIGYRAFYECKKLKTIIIPDSVTSIGEYAFYGCTSLTSVTIPNSVTEIGERAFYCCSSLTSITIPDSVTEIGGRAFYGCTSLTSVTIPDRVTEIGDLTFYGCTSLTSVTIPDHITKIGKQAFYNCTSLKDVYCKPTTPPSGGVAMFSYTSNGHYKPIGCKIYVPRASVDDYKAAEYWSEYAAYIEPYDF